MGVHVLEVKEGSLDSGFGELWVRCFLWFPSSSVHFVPLRAVISGPLL